VQGFALLFFKEVFRTFSYLSTFNVLYADFGIKNMLSNTDY